MECALRSCFCAASESANELGNRGGPKSRNRNIADSNPQSANPPIRAILCYRGECRPMTGKCNIASGVRNLNCAVLRTTSNSTPEGLVRVAR
eukprot:7907688-Alexandrium_andersonii.AAC.1